MQNHDQNFVSEPEAVAAKRFAIADAVARQIEIEQSNASARLNWNLTFQGFLFTSFAFLFTGQEGTPNSLIVLMLGLAGVFVSLATYLGVLASRRQSSALKRHWDSLNLDQTGYPRPFSAPLGSFLGRIPPPAICFTLAGTWASLVALVWL